MRQREQAVEPGRDRRQLVAQRPVGVRQLQARYVLERRERAAFDLAGVEQHVELPQRSAGIGDFEIVLGAEQPCPPVWRWPRVIAPSVSSRRAMVDRKRFPPFTLAAIGRKSGGCAWLVRWERPSP